MKKLWIAFAIAMAALMIIASPVFASGGNADADVDCSDIDVTDDSPPVGTTITFSGTVTITSNASAAGCCPWTYAESEVWYEIYDPNGVLIYSDSQYLYDYTWDYYSDAGQVYCWSVDVYIDMVGDYIAEHGGWAYAEYSYWERVWVPCGHCPSGGYWMWESRSGDDYDCCSANRTVTSHAGAGLGMVARPPRLTIQLPAGLEVEKPLHAEHFFPSDGWGDPTTEYIVYSDGIWQVEIADGTIIQLDGEWHKYTWIEVDDQGNVIGRYGSDGHIIAEEIGLSQPITITKVG